MLSRGAGIFFELCTDLNLFLALLIAYYRPVCLNLLLLLLLQVSDGARAWVGSFTSDCDSESAQQRHTNTGRVLETTE